MGQVNRVTSYFNQNLKAGQLLLKKQISYGVNDDRVQRLNDYIPTLWHSSSSAMMKYFNREKNIANVANELSIDTENYRS